VRVLVVRSPFPLGAAIYLALAAGGVFTNRPWSDEAWFASPAMNLATQSAVPISRYRSNVYAREYLPAAAFLKNHSTPGRVIMGSAEFAFQLGFHGDLVDDFRLGCRSGKRPSVVVMDKVRYQEWIRALQREEPAAYQCATSLLEHDFQLAYENPGYRVLVRVP
jgi:hypothetical protein